MLDKHKIDMLKASFSGKYIEAGVDEAGRGSLIGPVFAAAVILPAHFENKNLKDSKKLSQNQRNELRQEIEEKAISYTVSQASHQEIDKINILQATYLAMHRSIEQLEPQPELLLIDGNRFKPYPFIQHECVIKGDNLYASIAAASILAKTYRDDFIKNLAKDYPDYDWENNMGYATVKHREAIQKLGKSPWHRQSFHLKKR